MRSAMCGALLAMHTLFVWLLHLSVFCLTCLSCIDYVVAIWSTISHTALVGANKRLNTNRNTIKSSAKDCTNQLASNCTEKHHTEKNDARGSWIQPRHEDGDTNADADGGRYHNSENTQGLGMSVWADIKPTVYQPKMPFEIHLSSITLSC